MKTDYNTKLGMVQTFSKGHNNLKMDLSDVTKQKGVEHLTNEDTYLLTKNNNHDKYRVQPSPSKQRTVLVMIACMMQQLICNGIGFGLSVMYAELVIVFDAKRSNVALIQSIYMAIATGGGILFTGTIKKIGPGNSMIVGGILGCIGLIASSFADGLTAIILCTGVVASIGMCICYLASFISVSMMFSENTGFYLVTLSLGSSLGQFSVPVFYEIFIEQYSWSGTFLLLGGIALQTVPCGVIVHFSKQYYVTVKAEKSSSARLRSVCDVSVLKDFILWIILVNFHLVALTGNFESWFIVDFMISRGFTRESGSVLVSSLGFANLIGRFLGGVIRFRWINIPSVYHWVYLCPILAVGHVLIVVIYDYWGLFAITILYGVPFGVIASQVAAIILETTGLEKYPQAMAIGNLALGLANIISGQLGGFIKDTLGEYDLVFYIAAGVSMYISLTMLIVSFFVRKRKLQLNNSSQTSISVKYELIK